MEAARLLPALFAGALLCPVPGTGQQLDTADLRRTIEQWRIAWQVPGVAVAVIRGDDVLFLAGHGVRHSRGTDPVDAHTLFELGSATKTFTATLAALAVDDGSLRWRSPLIDLLPAFRLADEWLERHVTVLDALAHRSGVGRHDALWLGGAAAPDVLARLRHIGASAAFREEFSYSNLMYMAAGEALAAAADRSWEDLLAERILRPLGMTRSRVSQVVVPGNAAVPHVQLGDSVVPTPTPRTHVGPAGGLLATAWSHG